MSLKMKKTYRNISSYIAYKIYFHTCFIESSNCAVSKFHCAVKVFTVNWKIITKLHTFLIPYDYCGSLQWIIQEIKCFAFALVLYPFFSGDLVGTPGLIYKWELCGSECMDV